jgi:hypothetical protein
MLESWLHYSSVSKPLHALMHPQACFPWVCISRPRARQVTFQKIIFLLMFATAHRSRINTFFAMVIWFSFNLQNKKKMIRHMYIILQGFVILLSAYCIVKYDHTWPTGVWLVLLRTDPFCPQAHSRHLCHSFLLVRLFTRAAGFGLGFLSYSKKHISLGNRLYLQTHKQHTCTHN